jgi:class 3 adenylate cyclase
VSDITQAATKVQNGDYSVKLPEDRSDELGELKRTFNQMILGLKQRDMIERTFGRYVDKNVADELMYRPDALSLGGKKRTVTIMMADIRNFTNIAEKLEPEDVIKILNMYFAKMIEIIHKYRGIIVDFYGDSILVFFNGVEKDIASRASDAVQCALEMQNRQKDFAEEAKAEGLPEMQMGIGIHTGEVIVGNIGTETRAKYGIVGSNVNLTARIQTTASGGKTVISQETYDTIGPNVRVSADFSVCLKGVGGDRQLYEVEYMNREVEDRTT